MGTYKGNTESRKKATKKYLSSQAEIRVRVPKEDKAKYAAAADRDGLSLNKFAIKSMDERIERQESQKPKLKLNIHKADRS